jgi:hypothetical protein
MCEQKPKHHLHGIAPSDGETRVTRGPGFTLRGGDKETHEHMQDQAMIVHDELKKKGTNIADASCEQMKEAILRSEERMK